MEQATECEKLNRLPLPVYLGAVLLVLSLLLSLLLWRVVGAAETGAPRGLAWLVGAQAALGAVYYLWLAVAAVRQSRVVRACVRREWETQTALEEMCREAERANRAKSDFLSQMSHDIRTPLNGIIGMAEAARRNAEDPARVRDCMEKLGACSHHLLGLVNDVLDMSRIESGNMKIASEPLELHREVDACLTLISGSMEGRQLTLETQRVPGEALRVLGDGLHLRMILVNILSNAVKFTPDGGTIRFCSELLPETAPGLLRVRFTITDTGIGMHPEFLTRIFEPFSQEHEGSRSAYQGTGLGMAIARQTALCMGGTIDVESRLNEGTTFTVELPFALDETAPQPPTTAAEPALCLRGRRVLLAEDNELNTEILLMLLSEHGLETDAVENGALAVEMFRRSAPGSYDVILMDIMMPVLDGLAAARAIRAMERPDAKTVPIIAMTANAFAEDAAQSREAGMNEHLTKPLDAEALLDAIRRRCARES